MRTKRLIQVLYSGLGGHGSVAFSLVQADEAQRWSHGLIFYGVESIRQEYEEKAFDLGVDCYPVIKNEGLDWLAYRKLYDVLRISKPDVVVNHSPSALPAVWLYTRRHRAPFVTVEHESNAHKTWKNRLWSRMSLIGGSKMILLTDDYKAEYMEIHKHLAKPSRLEIINNGIDTDLFSPPVTLHSGECTRIGMASRLTPHRDHMGLIEAMASLRNRNISLEIAGSGETEASIREAIAARDLSSVVRLVGLLDEPQLVEFLQGCDIYVHASAFETMSTSIMQAMSVGLPVIGYDVPGVNNLIEHERTGILVPPHNPAALSSAVERLLDDHDLRQTLGRNARSAAERHLSFKVMLSRYEELFDSLQ